MAFSPILAALALGTRLEIRRAPGGSQTALWASKCARIDALSFPPNGLWSAAQHEAELCNGRTEVLGAWVGNEIVAFSCVSDILDETHVLSMVVQPEWRRRSLARTLLLSSMQSAFAACQALITLEVRASNTAATALYRSCGFEDVGARKRYYSNPEEE